MNPESPTLCPFPTFVALRFNLSRNLRAPLPLSPQLRVSIQPINSSPVPHAQEFRRPFRPRYPGWREPRAEARGYVPSSFQPDLRLRVPIEQKTKDPHLCEPFRPLLFCSFALLLLCSFAPLLLRAFAPLRFNLPHNLRAALRFLCHSAFRLIQKKFHHPHLCDPFRSSRLCVSIFPATSAISATSRFDSAEIFDPKLRVSIFTGSAGGFQNPRGSPRSRISGNHFRNPLDKCRRGDFRRRG